jgi:hypothetical protein
VPRGVYNLFAQATDNLDVSALFTPLPTNEDASRGAAPRTAAARRIFEIPPYFSRLEYACTDEGTNAFAYETG